MLPISLRSEDNGAMENRLEVIVGNAWLSMESVTPQETSQQNCVHASRHRRRSLAEGDLL
jgi:hypothetical protein